MRLGHYWVTRPGPARSDMALESDGRSWARTSDLQLVELALSRLSYAPGKRESSARPASPSEHLLGSSGACVGVRVQPAGRPLYVWENPRTDE